MQLQKVALTDVLAHDFTLEYAAVSHIRRYSPYFSYGIALHLQKKSASLVTNQAGFKEHHSKSSQKGGYHDIEALITNPEFQEQIKLIRQCPETLERNGEYWSKEDRETLRQLYQAGTGISEISVILQRSEFAVMMQLADMGEIRRSRRARTLEKGKCLCENCRRGPEHPDCPRCKKGRGANAGEL